MTGLDPAFVFSAEPKACDAVTGLSKSASFYFGEASRSKTTLPTIYGVLRSVARTKLRDLCKNSRRRVKTRGQQDASLSRRRVVCWSLVSVVSHEQQKLCLLTVSVVQLVIIRARARAASADGQPCVIRGYHQSICVCVVRPPNVMKDGCSTRNSSQWELQKSTQYLSCTKCELPLHLSIITCTTLFPLVTTSTATDCKGTQRSQKLKVTSERLVVITGAHAYVVHNNCVASPP